MSELVWGIKNGDLDQVKDIVEQKEIDVNKEIDGRPPLHYAADYGQGDVIQYLLSKGANVNEKGVNQVSYGSDEKNVAGRTILKCIVKMQTGRFLNASGSGQWLVAKDKHGISALLAAIWEGHTDCVKLLLEQGAVKDGSAPDGTSYVDAAEKEEIKQLLK